MKELTIVKVGGKVVEDEATLQLLLTNFSTILGPKILVHGGGRSASALALKLGIETKMVAGRRITDASMLEVATMVYGGLVNKNIVAKCQALSMKAIGLTGADMDVIRSVKRPVKDVDYGFVGDVVKVNDAALHAVLLEGNVPVLAPLTHDGQGQLLNTNADTIASHVAEAMSQRYSCSLVYCFEKPGVLSDPDDDDSVISSLTHERFKSLQKTGTINEGMIPKLDNGFRALKSGVRQVIITNTESLGTLSKSGTHLIG
jgi:acetylglutamate kinase